ncbi:hypothetical protein HYALB_00006323 [Hymenoscyphus albidus]|uniref:Uncharacterized protein n=1 Tax=Hymenoscyphus albidus TaxID=595503 RepID=A0A9N9LGU0_9HELO|nr:hypothetical protein HYALB_00006323 [Hymenoscyphus albidus]
MSIYNNISVRHRLSACSIHVGPLSKGSRKSFGLSLHQPSAKAGLRKRNVQPASRANFGLESAVMGPDNYKLNPFIPRYLNISPNIDKYNTLRGCETQELVEMAADGSEDYIELLFELHRRASNYLYYMGGKMASYDQQDRRNLVMEYIEKWKFGKIYGVDSEDDLQSRKDI